MWRLAAHLSLSEQQLDQLDAALQQLPSLEAAAAAGGGTAAGGAATGAGQLSRLQVFRADYARLRARAGCPGASADKVKQAFMLLLQHACRA
jgi:hypothetical protein